MTQESVSPERLNELIVAYNPFASKDSADVESALRELQALRLASATGSGEEVKKLRDAANIAILHVQELRDAWARGIINETDGSGGMRSNRNVEVEQKLCAALSAAQAHDTEEGM